MLFPEAKNEEKRKQILSEPFFSHQLSELEKKRQYYLSTPIEPVPFNLYKLFFTIGDRRLYETCYFAKRERLVIFTTAALLYNRKEDINALEDTIWAICDEYTWVLPAHTTDLGDCYDRSVIDLFSAETGFALAEIYYLLGEKLDIKIRRRILDSVEERIFVPYLSRNYYWETNQANWAAVCAGSVGATFIYLAPDRFENIQSRIINTLKTFLKGFGTDGVCVEGIGYWNYGFGYFTYFSQLLYEFTDGKENLFEIPICRKVALFQQNAFLRKNFTISFSDGSQTSGILPGLTQKLFDIYGSDIKMPLLDYSAFDDDSHRFAAYLRNFFWTDTRAIHSLDKNKETYYKSAGWYICNNSELSLAAKAGHNDEPHNHNDVGSFCLVCDDGQVLCDFGCGEYNRDYFDPEKRYTILCNSSLGHNLPIINSSPQSPGKEHSGKVIYAKDGVFSCEIAGAYDNCGLSSLTRKLTINNNIFELNDRYIFDNNSQNKVTERFVTMHKPEQTGNIIKILGYTLEYNPKCTPVISEDKLTDHFGTERIMYFIDFNLVNPDNFYIKISK